MCFPGKKIITFALASLLASQAVFSAPISTPTASVRNLDLTGDNRLYPLLKGVKLDLADPFKMEFVLDTPNNITPSKDEVAILIEYFLAALAMPQDELWVNLSPDEPGRIISLDLAKTHMGEIFLEQDYLLKHVASALTHPDTEAGKKYWQQRDVSVNMSKVWIVPGGATVEEDASGAYISQMALKVEDEGGNGSLKGSILPVLENQVNDSGDFAPLRQAYSAFVLAYWFKTKLRESIFKYYADNKKLAGIDNADKDAKEKVYAQYLEAFRKGVYDYTKTTVGYFGKIAKHRYFCGGIGMSSRGITFKPKTPGDDMPGPSVNVVFNPSAKGGAYKRVSPTIIETKEVDHSPYWHVKDDPNDPMNKTPNGPIEIFGQKVSIVIDNDYPLPVALRGFGFRDDFQGVLVVVMKESIYNDEKKRAEMIEHECLEYKWTRDKRVYDIASDMAADALLSPGVTVSFTDIKDACIRQLAHHFASEEYIAKHFNGYDLSPIHADEVKGMTHLLKQKLMAENRSRYANLRKGIFTPEEIAKIELYEKLMIAAILRPPANVDVASQNVYNRLSDTHNLRLSAPFYLSDLCEALEDTLRVMREARAKRLNFLTIDIPGLSNTYVTNRILDSAAGVDMVDYVEGILDKLRGLVSDENADIDLTYLSGEGIVRFLQAKDILPADIRADAQRSGVVDKTLNYKRLGIDNIPVIEDAFKREYERISTADPARTQKRRWTTGYYQAETLVIEALPDFPVPDNAPAISFFNSKGRMVTVVNKGLDKKIKDGDKVSEYDEAIMHELLEWVNFQSTKTLMRVAYSMTDVDDVVARAAHFFATAELIKMYSNGRLLPLHKRDIAMIDIDTAKALLGEDRDPQYQCIGEFMPAALPVIKRYENEVVRLALQARIKELSVTTTQPIHAGVLGRKSVRNGGVVIGAQGIITTGKGADFQLSPDVLQQLQEADGMDFLITSIKSYKENMR